MNLSESDSSSCDSTESCSSESDFEENSDKVTEKKAEEPRSYRLLIGLTVVSAIAILVPLLSNSSEPDLYTPKKCLKPGDRLFDSATLAQYKTGKKVYLGFLGTVYDVSAGDYYREGGGYHFFAGIDGTRAFLNGEFVEAELRDNIEDLDDSYMSGVEQWRSLYESKYKRVGVLIGSYYDSNACPRKALADVDKRLKKLQNSQTSEKDEQLVYPPCNFEYSAADNRGRLWCSKSSGGIERSWTGVPRNMYSKITKQWRCACLQNGDRDIQDQLCDSKGKKKKNDHKHKKGANKPTGVSYADEPECTFKHYENCDVRSVECNYK